MSVTQRHAISGDAGDELTFHERLSRLVAYLGPLLLLRPDSAFRLRWNGITVLIVGFMAAYLPYHVCFALPWSPPFAIFCFCADLFFMFDIVLNFLTGYMHDGKVRINAGVASPKARTLPMFQAWF